MLKCRLIPLLVCTAFLGCSDATTGPASLPAPDAVAALGPSLASARGGASWTIPPERFGFEIGNVLSFTATKYADGSVNGRINYHQSFLGFAIHLDARVTCMEVYDGNRVKYGGVVEVSNDPDIVPGETFIWFQGLDHGEGASAAPDQSTIAGVGDAAANAAFCASNAPPRNIFDITGNIQVNQ
jgi:hypothetical protein